MLRKIEDCYLVKKIMTKEKGCHTSVAAFFRLCDNIGLHVYHRASPNVIPEFFNLSVYFIIIFSNSFCELAIIDNRIKIFEKWFCTI